MGKTVKKNAPAKEIAFFEEFESNANLSDNFNKFIRYGFFHFTPAKNLKIGRDGTEETSIEKTGINPLIGKHSEGYESDKRAYYAVGALGVLGLINRSIAISIANFMKDETIGFEEAKKKAFEATTRGFLEDAVCLKMNIEDGVEYDSQDFMSIRNSHTIKDTQIPSEKLSVLSVDGSTDGFSIFEFFIKTVIVIKL